MRQIIFKNYTRQFWTFAHNRLFLFLNGFLTQMRNGTGAVLWLLFENLVFTSYSLMILIYRTFKFANMAYALILELSKFKNVNEQGGRIRGTWLCKYGSCRNFTNHSRFLDVTVIIYTLTHIQFYIKPVLFDIILVHKSIFLL